MHRWLPIPLVVSYFSHFAHARYAETVNGQQHTLGISIISAPAANSEYNVPGNLPVAIDVSGNGKLSNDTDAHMSSLELYLVSSSTNVNVTISDSSARLIDTESGSTVKHVNFQLPDCLPAGQYNLTLYDTGSYEDQAYFTITAVPLTLRSSSTSTSASCDSAKRPAAQPQADSPLGFAPFAPGQRVPKGKGEVPTESQGGTDEPGTTSSEPSPIPTPTPTETETTSPTTSDFTFPAQPTRPGSMSGFGVPQPSEEDQADEPGSGSVVVPSTETDDGSDTYPSDIPNMPVPVPEQVITIHGGFIVPVLSDSALSLGPCVLFAATASAVLVSQLL